MAIKLTKKHGMRWLLGSAILAGISLGGWGIYVWQIRHTSQTVVARVLQVKKDTVEEVVNENGTVKLGGQQTLKAPIEGIVKEVLVDAGDRVNRGNLLIVLADVDQQSQLEKQELEIAKHQITLENQRQKGREAQQKLENAQAKLQTLQAGNSEYHRELREKQLEIAQQKRKIDNQVQTVREAKADLANAERKRQNAQTLLDKEFISEDSYFDTEKNVRDARARLRSQEITLEEEKINLQKQRLNVEDIQQTIQEKLREAREQVASAKTNLQQAQVELETSLLKQEELMLKRQELLSEQQKRRIRAPFAGVVLDVKTLAEDVVSQEDELVILGNPQQEVVELQLPIFTASQVEPNQQARINKIGPQMETFSGKIEHIALLADSDNNNSESSGKIPVTIQLDKPTGELIPGSQVSVEIVVQQRQDVVAVPTEAVMAMGSEKPFVWLQDEQNQLQQQPIEIGMEGLTKVEVKEGLQIGDRIVLPTPDMNLEPGMLVAAKPKPKPSESEQE
jgi:HlyD family secretion protein